MANSKQTDHLCHRPYLPLGLLLAVLLPLPAPAAPLRQSTADIIVESDGAEVDARTKQLLLPKVRISQEGYVIQADEARATGLDFENSTWVFNGKVDITTPEGSSAADHATVIFVQHQITELHLAGQPATFEQHDASKQTLAQGRANTVDYDVLRNTVRLSGRAWVRYGQNEFTGTTVVYDIINQRVLASREEQQGERVRITINPNSEKPAVNKPPATGNKSSKP